MGFRRSRRLWVAGEVKGSWSKIGGSKALALGSPAKSKIGLCVRGTKSLGCRRSRRLMGRRQWALSSSSLSISLFARGRDLTLTLSLSLSVFQKMIFEGKIKTEIILHPTHGQTEKNFRKMYFPCATKHPHLRKSISRISLKPKQTKPKSLSNHSSSFCLFFYFKNFHKELNIQMGFGIKQLIGWSNGLEHNLR